VGLATQVSNKSRGRGECVVCYKCRKNGHDMKVCFQIVGYVKWWGDRPRHEGRGAGRGSGRQGMHNQGTQAHANVACTEASGSHVNNLKENNLDMTGLTNEQWKELVDMINKQNSNGYEKMTSKRIWDLWVIDSGASNHMTGTLENFCEKMTIPGCPVGLPDVERVLACKQKELWFFKEDLN